VLAAAETAQGRLSPIVAGRCESEPYGVALTTDHEHRRQPTRGSLPYRVTSEECAMPVASDPVSSPARLYIGIDIAAATFTAVWMELGAAPRRPVTLDQTPQGFATLQARLLATGHTAANTLVVMEATGSYWVALATMLAQAGFAVAVINPDQAHSFAKALDTSPRLPGSPDDLVKPIGRECGR